MPLFGMASKVRRDPMGPATMGLLKNNAEWVRRFSLFEHIQSSGEHNTREIPRVVRRISGTTVSPASSDITAVTNGTTGTYVLTLAASRFNADWMTCQINPCGAGVASKPYLAGYKVVSATSVEVYLKQLSSTLGDEAAGNTWAAANVDFDIAIHSEPLAAGSYPTALPSNSLTGDTLKPTRWIALVKNSADAYKMLTAEHAADGTHNTRQVASRSGMWRYDGAAVALEAGEADSITVTRSSAGVYAVASSKALYAETHCFVSPDYARLNSGDSDDIFRMHALQTSTTAWTVYMYRFNTTTNVWTAADGDFWLAMHGGNGP